MQNKKAEFLLQNHKIKMQWK